jgi:hypothetical protein
MGVRNGRLQEIWADLSGGEGTVEDRCGLGNHDLIPKLAVLILQQDDVARPHPPARPGAPRAGA